MRRLLCIAFFSLLALGLGGRGYAQGRHGFSISNKRLIRYYKEAVETMNLGDWGQAQIQFEELAENNPTFVEPCIALAYLHEQKEEYKVSYNCCLQALTRDSIRYPLVYLNAGRMAYMAGLYHKGIEFLERFLSIPKQKAKYRKQAKRVLRSCRYASTAPTASIDSEPEPLGPAVNTEMDEYFPSLSADGTTLCFTRLQNWARERRTSQFQRVQEDLFIARRRSPKAGWQKARSLGNPICTTINEGSQSLTANGHEMYFTRCDGVCHLYYSKQNRQGQWTKPVLLPEPVNLLGHSSKQPSISPDGKELYFCSGRPGTLGGLDLWVAKCDDNGRWVSVENLGPTVNTESDEQWPFMHFDNQTLYFSSEGHPGMGALDLYMTKKLSDTAWSTPQNLGPPINSNAVDMGLVISAQGDTAYYASERNAEQGLDLYKFAIPDTVRPTPVSYLRGIVQDGDNGTPLRASILLLDIRNGDTVMSLRTNDFGYFLVCLPIGRTYGLFASSSGYFDHSMHFNFEGQHPVDKPYKQTIGLKKMRKGITMTLANVFFDTDSHALKADSYVELDRWVNLMKAQRKLRVRIVGHTDNQGTAEHNQQLSLRRARSVAEYLESKGISAKRIESKGYGDTRPVATNATEEGRAKNRRTECEVVEI